jgi:hypothetical protein
MIWTTDTLTLRKASAPRIQSQRPGSWIALVSARLPTAGDWGRRQGSEKAERPRAQEAGRAQVRRGRQRTRRAQAQVSRRLVCWYSASVPSRTPLSRDYVTDPKSQFPSPKSQVRLKGGLLRKPPSAWGCCGVAYHCQRSGGCVAWLILSLACLRSFSGLFVWFGLGWDLKKGVWSCWIMLWSYTSL